MPRSEDTVALDIESLPQVAEDSRPSRDSDPIAGILMALGGSLLLWAALASIARLVARVFI